MNKLYKKNQNLVLILIYYSMFFIIAPFLSQLLFDFKMYNILTMNLINIIIYSILAVITLSLYKNNLQAEFYKNKKNRLIKNSMIAFLFMFGVKIAAAMVTANFFGEFNSENQEALDTMVNLPLPLYLLMIGTVSVIGPIIEEIVYRYIIQNFFKKCLKSRIISILLSSLLFGFIHTRNFQPEIIIYFSMGLALGIIYEKSDNILISIGAHMLNNIFSVIVMALTL